ACTPTCTTPSSPARRPSRVTASAAWDGHESRLARLGRAAPHRSPQPRCFNLTRGRNRHDVTSLRPGPLRCHIVAVAENGPAQAAAPRAAGGTPEARPPGSTALSRLALQVTLRGMR